MKIITAPHPSLRQTAKPIKELNQEIFQLARDLPQTLINKTNPSGVGLAAPQVNQLWRMFVVNFAQDEKSKPAIELYLNPVITKHSPNQSFGEDEQQPVLEGCLSIPFIYGPIPRWEWIEIEYDQIKNEQLQRTSQRLSWFPARVAQHELDHLNGILFTDYTLQYDLPLYREDRKKQKLEAIDTQVVELF